MTTNGSNQQRSIIYSALVSLDGYIAGPNGELDWHRIDDEFHENISSHEREIDTYFFGRRMYQTMRFWDDAEHDTSLSEPEREFSRTWNQQQKVVFSRTLDQVGHNARLATRDIPDEVAAVRAQPGKAIGLGGADLAASFARLNLIDEYRLYIQPVILGAGKPFFASLPEPQNLELIETQSFGAGVVYLCYRPVASWTSDD